MSVTVAWLRQPRAHDVSAFTGLRKYVELGLHLGHAVELHVDRSSQYEHLCLVLLKKSGELRDRRRFHDQRSIRLGALGLLYHSAQGSPRAEAHQFGGAAADMATRAPTRRGDVLIPMTEQNRTDSGPLQHVTIGGFCSVFATLIQEAVDFGRRRLGRRC